MKVKTLFISFLFYVVCVCYLFAQEHVSHYFDLESEFILDESSCAYQTDGLIGCISGDELFFSSRLAPKEGKGYVLTVDVLNLQTHDFRKLIVRLPAIKQQIWFSKKIWIYSLQVCGDRLLVASDYHLLVYDLKSEPELKLLDSWEFPNSYYGFCNGKKFYGMSMVNDYGFVLRKQSGRQLDSIAAFPMVAPFLLQYGPNGYIKQLNGKLYFLDSPSKGIRVFDLSGNLLQKIEMEIPNWNPIPDSYIAEIMKMPYSGDRAMHVYYTSKDYSIPMEIFPLNDKDLLIAYYQREEGFPPLHFWLVRNDSSGTRKQIPLEMQFENDHTIAADEFPLLFVGLELRLSVTGENQVVQLVKAGKADYVGKTWKEYSEADNATLATQRPDVKVRVMRLRPDYPVVPKDSLPLLDFEGHPFVWDSIPSQRAIMFLNRQPQCHACAEQLAVFANTLGLKDCSLYVIDSYADSYMKRYECIDIAKQRFKVPFNSLFLTSKDSERLSQLLKTPSFPLVLLWERGSSNVRVVSGLDLFPDNLMDPNVRKEASEYLRKFAH